MGELVGYMRISTKEQKLDLQRDALLAAGVAERYVYEDVASGAKQARPGLAACLKLTFRTPRIAIHVFSLGHFSPRTTHPHSVMLFSYERRDIKRLHLRSVVWGSFYRLSKRTKSNICPL